MTSNNSTDMSRCLKASHFDGQESTQRLRNPKVHYTMITARYWSLC